MTIEEGQAPAPVEGREDDRRPGVRGAGRVGPGERVKAKIDFERLRAEGRRGGDGALRAQVARNGLAWTRIAFAVPRRHGPAVQRNRFRRVCLAAFRDVKGALPVGLDIVLSPVPNAPPPTLAAARESLVRVVGQVAARLPRDPAGVALRAPPPRRGKVGGSAPRVVDADLAAEPASAAPPAPQPREGAP